MKRIALIVVAVVAPACGRGGRLTSCDDSLAGVWVSPDATRWVMLDNGPRLEAYPMFDDANGSGEITIAPRVIDLRREGQVAGEVQRRYMLRGDICEARATVSVTACHDDVIELQRGDVGAPIAFAPCRWQTSAPPHAERWHRD